MRRLLNFVFLICLSFIFITGCHSHNTDNRLTKQNVNVYKTDIKEISNAVYITRTGEKYHTKDCSYLKSRIQITLTDAKKNGYEPCKRCNP